MPLAPSRSTCAPWATLADLCSPCDDYDTIDPALLEDCLQGASDLLYALTGSRYPGECSDTIRPATRVACYHDRSAGDPWCWTCGWPYALRLPRTPVVSITAVTIDGETVDPARYRVDNWRWLVYQPESATAARQHWPEVQRLELPAGEVGTWSVEYVAGQGPPLGGIRGAARLGCQWALACQPEATDACELPEGLVSVARQQVTLQFANPMELTINGLTGLEDVDRWIIAERKRAAYRPATVRVPGRRGPRVIRTTWP